MNIDCNVKHFCTFCLKNKQNVQKKKRGEHLFARYSPRILMIFSILFLFESALGGSKTCDGHTEWRARSILHAKLSAELN